MTGSLLTRLFRYGMIVRSLAFPGALIALTLLLTVWVVTGTQPPPRLAVSPELASSQLEVALAEVGLDMAVTDAPREWVETGRAVGGSDGQSYFVPATTRSSLAGEYALRGVLGTSWRPAIPDLPGPEQVQTLGALIGRILLGIFSLYGVVFGAAMVARDREDGSLEVDCSLAIPRWVHGTARLLAGSLVLCAFLATSLLMLQSLIGVEDLLGWTGHGTAAAIGSVSLGMVSAGRSKSRTGLGTALALGLTLVTGFFGVGVVAPWIGQWLPMASIVTGGSPVGALVTALLLAVTSATLLTRFGLRAG